MRDYHTYKEAKKRVKAKKGFYSHLSVFIAVTVFFVILNLVSSFNGNRELWFFYPILPWSIGLIIHYLTIFGFPGSRALSKEWEERELEKEMERLERLKYPKPSRKHKQEEEETLELNELERIRRKGWDDEDFV